jgi:SET domain-containing protein 6
MLVAAKWEWEQYLEPVRGELGGGGGEVATTLGLSFDAYLAARSVVTSRAFAVDERHSNGFVPLADLFNHVTGSAHVQFSDVGVLPRPSTPPHATFDEVNAAGLGVEAAERGDPSEWAEVVATRAVGVGEEMFNSYGHLCNGALLASYGFTHDANPADCVTLPAAALRAAVAVAGGVQGGALARQSRWCMQAGLLGPPRHADPAPSA